jgi:hypothetical protein
VPSSAPVHYQNSFFPDSEPLSGVITIISFNSTLESPEVPVINLSAYPPLEREA